MPKVELHVHLEGAIRPATLMHLAAKNRVNLPPKTLEEFDKWYEFVDFPHFAQVFQASSRCIQSAEDIHRITVDFLDGQAEQNIIHTEATYTAFTHYKTAGIPFDEQIGAIRDAANAAYSRHGITFGVIVDIARGMVSDAEAMQTAQWVADAHGDGLVIALGLGGYEKPHPAENYVTPFEFVRDAGVPAVVHAGETGGPQSIRAAVEQLNAIRVGHGVTALEDPSVVSLLKERGIVLEVCPTSNLCIGVADRIENHALPHLIEAGLKITIGTDDPPIFNTTLVDEYQKIADAFGYGRDHLIEFNRVAVEAALVSESRRAELQATLGD
ncbi:adenosine deaminase [Gymnodinialimonas hymeniacidonis]|uniref:adenosine deaminase n=1 Tax=Gymnodinialimonas hymeniacidonis TaxID=3126508 RepID=UPI0034C69367